MNRLKELRIQHGYKTQKELADHLFVNQTAVSQWERGATTPSSQMLQHLSELYQVSIDYLLGRDEKKEPTPGYGGGQDDPLRSTLLRNFDQLNQEGRERLVETSDDIVSSGKYIKSDPAGLGKAPTA